MEEHMLSTIDNPWNPFTEFDEWKAYDESHGYNSLSLLGRIVVTSNDLSQVDESQAIENAIEEIVELNVSGVHIMVPKPESLAV
jgi:hypothetical protein